MPWQTVIDPLGNLGLSALMAAVPVIYLFWALAFKRMAGHWAAMSAVGIALLIAIIGYGMPVQYAVLATLIWLFVRFVAGGVDHCHSPFHL